VTRRNFHVSERLWDRAKEYARSHDIPYNSASKVTRMALREFLDAEQKGKRTALERNEENAPDRDTPDSSDENAGGVEDPTGVDPPTPDRSPGVGDRGGGDVPLAPDVERVAGQTERAGDGPANGSGTPDDEAGEKTTDDSADVDGGSERSGPTLFGFLD